jgi:hypothetical protein
MAVWVTSNSAFVTSVQDADISAVESHAPGRQQFIRAIQERVKL